MPETRDLPVGLYLHLFEYPPTNGTPPVVESATSREVEPPYRIGRGFSLRLWGRRALIVGRWGKPRRKSDEDDVLEEAIEGRILPYTADEIADW